MLRQTTRNIVRGWPILLAFWVLAFAAAVMFSPNWERVVVQGEFAFLPEWAESQAADELLAEAFPNADYGSSLLFLISREDKPLSTSDILFIDEQLLPLARKAVDEAAQDGEQTDSKPTEIIGVLSPAVPVIGNQLESEDNHAALALIQLSAGFLHEQTWSYINEVEADLDRLVQDGVVPKGLEIHLGGSAVLGRDITQYRTLSGQWIQKYTVWLVVGLLFVVFRAPVIALIPLVTLAVAVKTAMALLAMMADAGWITLFDGIEVYLTVVAYGAGVDYSMFLISRYQEELRRHASSGEALRVALEMTGTAIAASACTEIFGIGMLFFALFGKLSLSGTAIAFALCVMLVASLTLTPAVLRLGGRWAFWPQQPKFHPGETYSTRTEAVWEKVGKRLVARPATLLTVALLMLGPVAAYGVLRFDRLSYGLFAELPSDSTTVRGLKAIDDHFPIGMIGPTTVLLQNPNVNFNTPEAQQALSEWTSRIHDQRDRLQLADIHSFSEPLGIHQSVPVLGESDTLQFATSELKAFQSARYYISQSEPHIGAVTRLRLTTKLDPFSREAIAQMDEHEAALAELLPDSIRDGASLHFSGATSSLRSMRRVAIADQKLILPLVSITVLVVLVALLRRFVIAVYLVLTVGLSFLVTFGFTWAVFRLLVGPEFPGLDWSVPLLLFTVLMAVGADYNVLLVSRAQEEIDRLGVDDGVIEAVRSTGAVITGCGVVMAGTFSTLLIGGQLQSMQQLGVALTFAILLDTFVVRSILVPSFLVMHGRRADKRRGGKVAESNGD